MALSQALCWHPNLVGKPCSAVSYSLGLGGETKKVTHRAGFEATEEQDFGTSSDGNLNPGDHVHLAGQQQGCDPGSLVPHWFGTLPGVSLFFHGTQYLLPSWSQPVPIPLLLSVSLDQRGVKDSAPGCDFQVRAAEVYMRFPGACWLITRAFCGPAKSI